MNELQIPICTICGGLTEIKHASFPGYQQPETFQIFHCSQCNTSFALPRPSTDSLYEIIYRNEETIPGYNRYWEYAKEIKNQVNPLEYLAHSEEAYWGVNEALKQIVKGKESPAILEIGSGLGYFTYALNKAGYNTIGLDISQTAVNQAINSFGDLYICDDLFKYAEAQLASFDIVILTEVIEHVENPLTFITVIKQLLKPAGHTIITTPNKSFYPNNIIWSTELPPIHLWWLSESSMTCLANNTGMNISFIDYAAFYITHYWAMDMNKLSQSPVSEPILNQNGELMRIKNQPYTQPNSPLWTLFSKIPLLTKTYRSLKHLFNKNLVVCGRRGPILCAVLQKQ